jgi:hypothetical protein
LTAGLFCFTAAVLTGAFLPLPKRIQHKWLLPSEDGDVLITELEIKKSNYLFVVALPPAQQIHAHNKNFFYTNTVVRNFISYSPIASRLNFLSKPNASNG